MRPTDTKDRITFAVDDVQPASTALPVRKVYDHLRDAVEAENRGTYDAPPDVPGPLETCYSYTDDVVDTEPCHPIVAAVHLAFSDHRPLVLTPDSVWLTIAQGFANHVANHSESLRRYMVPHQGRAEIQIDVRGFMAGAPENPWHIVFPDFVREIEARAPTDFQWLLADFSTSGPLELLVSQIVFMDAFQPYYAFRVACVCGIPSVTLEGSFTDWEQLRAKAENLQTFECDWWLEKLMPVLDHFVRARRGDVDVDHWRRIYKLRQAYGAERMNGWIGHLFPYVKDSGTGCYTERNPLLDLSDADWDNAELFEDAGITSDRLPSGLSFVPFQYKDRVTTKSMEFIGGLVGVEQNRESLALKPRAGWAVRERHSFFGLIEHVLTLGEARPARKNFLDALDSGELFLLGELPADLLALYSRCDGLTLSQWKLTMLPADAWTLLCVKEVHESGSVSYTDIRGLAIGRLDDGAWIALDDYGHRLVLERNSEDRVTIANSLEEFLRRLVEDESEAYFLKKDFIPEEMP